MAKNDKVELSPDWYTLRVGEDGECTFKEKPPAPVGTTTKKGAATGATQTSEGSMAPTEQATKPKRKASPRTVSSRPSKTSASPSSSESSRSSASSLPPRRPNARAHKTREPDIVEVSDSDTSADKSAVTETQTTRTRRSRAGATRTSRHSPALPRTAVTGRSSPFGEAAFSGRGWERFYHTETTVVVTAPSGNALNAQATRIRGAPRGD